MKNLKTSKNTQKILAISTIILLTAVMFLAVPTQAEVITIGAPELADWSTTVPEGITPSISIDTRSYISLSPNPIGVGQSLLINLWLEPPSQYNRYFSGFTVTSQNLTEPPKALAHSTRIKATQQHGYSTLLIR